MLILKATHKAIASGNYADGKKEIAGLLKGECRPEDHREPGFDTLAKRLADGQASRSPRVAPRQNRARKEKVGFDRQETAGIDREPGDSVMMTPDYELDDAKGGE